MCHPPVYPRPRGEYLAQLENLIERGGLPPPTRGIPQSPLALPLQAGSTPAHAGNTGSLAMI